VSIAFFSERENKIFSPKYGAEGSHKNNFLKMGRRTKKFEKPWFRQHLVLSDQRSPTFLKL